MSTPSPISSGYTMTYGRIRQEPTSWDSHFMWRCSRHIPSSKVYLSIMEKCPSCKQPRPPLSLRPPDPNADTQPTVEMSVDPPIPTMGEPDSKDPEQVQEPAIIELPPAIVTVESLENMRVLREVNAEVREADGETQDFDTEVSAPVVEPPVTVVERPRTKKAVCPGPSCRKYCRENSPYCSKICSDRCLRLRKKALKAPLLGKELKDLNRILSALESWGKK